MNERVNIIEMADRIRSELARKLNGEHDPRQHEAGGEESASVPLFPARSLVTDQANSDRIMRNFGAQLISVGGRFYWWDGARWMADADDAAAIRLARGLSKIILDEADDWAAKKGPEEEVDGARKITEALRKWAKASEMKRTMDSALGLVRKAVAVDSSTLDSDPWLLNVKNGTIDLRTGELRPHDPKLYMTKMAPVAYSENATAPAWEAFLWQITGAATDKTRTVLLPFLQRWFGYCATALTREHAFAVLYGRGSNGKSTLIDIVSEVLGDYAGAAAPDLLVGDGDSRHPTEIADLLGRRMVTAHETDDGSQLREGFIKKVTGGDKLKGRYMRRDFFQFDPTHKLHLVTNHKPVVKGSDDGIWRRVLLVPFTVRFGTAEEVAAKKAAFVKDTALAGQLRKEAPGVLRWIVDGSRQWAESGLKPPDIVLNAVSEYRKEQDRAAEFVDECCAFDTTARVQTTEIYKRYVDWAKECGYYALGRSRFVDELERVTPGFQRVRKDSGRYIGGLRLLPGEAPSWKS